VLEKRHWGGRGIRLCTGTFALVSGVDVEGRKSAARVVRGLMGTETAIKYKEYVAQRSNEVEALVEYCAIQADGVKPRESNQQPCIRQNHDVNSAYKHHTSSQYTA